MARATSGCRRCERRADLTPAVSGSGQAEDGADPGGDRLLQKVERTGDIGGDEILPRVGRDMRLVQRCGVEDVADPFSAVPSVRFGAGSRPSDARGFPTIEIHCIFISWRHILSS